jgi:hypothetical protein
VGHQIFRLNEAEVLAWVRDGFEAMDQPSGDGVNTYSYDAFNRLTRITRKSYKTIVTSRLAATAGEVSVTVHQSRYHGGAAQVDLFGRESRGKRGEVAPHPHDTLTANEQMLPAKGARRDYGAVSEQNEHPERYPPAPGAVSFSL